MVLTGFVFYKLVYSYHINQLWARFEPNEGTGSSVFLMLACLGMFFNWGLEAIKWKMLIRKFEAVSSFTAVKAVLSGVTLSIITPNQIGDFAGRVIHLELLNKVRGSLITVIGHTAQVIITLVFGFISLSFFSIHYAGVWYWIPVAAIIVALALWIYLNLARVYRWFDQFKWFIRFEKYADVFAAFQNKELLQILLLSFLRYLIFLFQYYALLLFFQVDIGLLPALACIIGTFCIQSVVPSFLILELGLRGASALAFFTLFSNNHDGILLAAYSLWMVNMLVPAILGMYFIYKAKW